MMSSGGLVLVGLLVLLLGLFPEVCIAIAASRQCTSSCGNMHNIQYPFRLKGDPPKCGHYGYELACEDDHTTLNMYSGRKYYVQEISYVNKTIRLVDASIKNDSCSLPGASLTGERVDCPYHHRLHPSSYGVFFMNCSTPVNSPFFVDATPCINESSYYYAFYGRLLASRVPKSCSIKVVVPALFSDTTCQSISDIHHQLLKGFDLSYGGHKGAKCSNYRFQTILAIIKFYLFLVPWQYTHWFDWQSYVAYVLGQVISIILKGLIIGRTMGILCLIVFSIYKCQRRHLSVDDTIEEFLHSHNNFIPIRYSYSEIKEMTKGFKYKLGQGGYGSVYKGKARSGHLVAVKVLGTSKANGKDFISEVATIGRIFHVNVVGLTGFCVEGSKRALIYDFMPNGSLDKFIFHEGEKNPLSWERMYMIGLGVAQGIEYLHRGCEMQILHFDIKPHNILLDENFIPKISDFGLAKLYPIDDSIVCLTTTRGTPGYIAPELFYKHIGGVSYKADVYSFGMLLMEMVRKRKNVNACAEHWSQIYFPSWIYDRISQGEDIEFGDANQDEQKIVRKMIIVALWCTQMKPMDRPSMSKVLKMLEGELELLQMPPKAFLCPQAMSNEDHADINPRGAPISSYNEMDTITLDVR